MNTKQTEQPTVEELNLAQEAWMKLHFRASAAEVARVTKLMASKPRVYLSAHGESAVVVHSGLPICVPLPWPQAEALCVAHHGRVDIAWDGHQGKWVQR